MATQPTIHEQTQDTTETEATFISISRRSLLFIYLLFLLFLGVVDTQIISPILPALKADFEVSTATAGMAVTSYALAASLWALIIGPLSDRFGRLIFLRYASLLFASTALLTYFAEHFALYLLARIAAGMVGGTISACVIAQVADMFHYERRGRAMGWVGAMYFIASVFGVPGGTWIAGQFGWRTLYLMTAAGAALPLIAISNQMIREFSPSRMTAPRLSLSSRAVKSQLSSYLRYWLSPSSRTGLMLAFCFAATAASLITYLGDWLVNKLAFPINAVAMIFFVTFLASTIGALSGGWLADVWGRNRVIIAGSILLAAMLLLIPFLESLQYVYVAFAAGGLFLGLRQGPYQALTTELVSQEDRGAYIAMRNSTSQLAIGFGAFVSGILYDSHGFFAVSLLATGFALLTIWVTNLIANPHSHD